MLRTKFLEILKDAYPQGYSPTLTSANELQLFRETMAYALEYVVEHEAAKCEICGRPEYAHSPSGHDFKQKVTPTSRS